jgi:predicted restriction endonuclease
MVIVVDKIWKKLIVIPYNTLQQYDYPMKNNDWMQHSFKIVRRDGEYYTKNRPSVWLGEYEMSLDFMLDMFKKRLEDTIALLEIPDDEQFLDVVERSRPDDPDLRDREIARLDFEAKDPERIFTETQRIKRNNRLKELLKIRYNFRCQFCGYTFKQKNGKYYAEAAHIKPVSDEGPDISSNIVILCPNHHKKLDLAQVEILNHGNRIEFHFVDEKYSIDL